MNLNQLEYFVHTAEMGSLSKAAIVLNIAQSALSRQIRLLEADLHVTLLLRNGRGVVLTEAGKRLFDHSIAILQLVSRVREDIDATRDEPVGRIVVGLPPTMGRMLTLPLVEGFKRVLPKARLAIVEGLSTHLAEWVSTGRVDIGLLHNPESQPSLEIIPVLQEPLVLVSPAGSKVGKDATINFEDLVNYPLIMPERAHAHPQTYRNPGCSDGAEIAGGLGDFKRSIHTGPGACRPWPCCVVAQRNCNRATT